MGGTSQNRLRNGKNEEIEGLRILGIKELWNA
jgi:hypothetical protein